MPASTSSSGMSMGGMGGMGGSHCKISMLWNWYTVDSCFISSTWHITSKGRFAGSCIGVICLVVILEALRRMQREYDRFLIKQAQAHADRINSSTRENGSDFDRSPVIEANQNLKEQGNHVSIVRKSSSPVSSKGIVLAAPLQYKPTIIQQAIRSLIHMLQFAVAYFIMLLAMYYNGYIIICIIIGAFLGFFLCSWEGIRVVNA
ncbi:MAG: hypothetical protein LQ350_008277 [Teloschistes chrysophthalmus]|nr:MAG: hypothetical protein LQ350_008277 [Niorma chrysophthalma]